MCHTTSWVVTGSQTMQDTHPAVPRKRLAPAEAATPDEARGGVAEQRAGATLSGSESAVGPDVRRDVLVEVITSKLREDYWVESQSETETEARLVVLGRKLRFRLRRPCPGGEGDRESGRAGAYENRAVTRAALLSEIAALCASVEGESIPEGR
jgi:hypothetical protein